jgi:pimeloyl-ACP methyl ester carboxylesterase
MNQFKFDEAGHGPAIVFLHGFPFNRSMWHEQIEFLGARGYRAVAPDLRGLGVSDKLQFVVDAGGEPNRQAEARRTIVTMDEMARDVAALMDQLEIESAVVCGLSMGCYVAFEFVRLFPRRVRALVLAGARAQGADEAERESREQQAQRVIAEGMSFAVDSILTNLLAPLTVAEKPEVTSWVREMIVNTEPQGAAAAQRGMAIRRDYAADLAHIGVPTLIVAGRDDGIRKPADAEFIYRNIRNSRIEVIADAGHLMNMEQPESFNRVLLSFLSQLNH